MSAVGTDGLAFEPLLERDGLAVSRSPWGEDDEIGRLNMMTPESRAAVLGALDGTALLDLSVDYHVGMPSWSAAGDPQYDIWLTHTPQGSIHDNLSGAGAAVHERYSYAGDSISMYTHCGTHLDTLNHFGHYGCFWNGWRPEADLGSRHWLKGGADRLPPIVARGVLLDVAAAHGVECLPDRYGIGADELRKVASTQGVELRPGDVVLVRTGRMTRWPDRDGYLLDPPGITLEAARFLCEEAGAMCLGSDTICLEVFPWSVEESFCPVHAYLCATAGAIIMEVVQLEELAAERLYEFGFVGASLRLRGATGAPFRPLAIPLRR